MGKIGLILGALTFAFALYVHFVVVPASEGAEAKMESIRASTELSGNQTYADIPGYTEAFQSMEKKTDFGGYVFFASMLPLLLCLIASIKKDKMGLIGLLLSLGAFFIGAGYGTHMFS